MLDEITPKQFAEWYAAWKIGLDWDGWHQTATVCETIQNEFTKYKFDKAGKPYQKKAFNSAKDYFPKSMIRKPKRAKDR